jgi:hypothetical protein
MKPSLDGLEGNLRSENPFLLAKKKSLYFSIKEDFSNRVPILQVNFSKFCVGVLCRRRRDLSYLRLHLRSSKKVTDDLDILKIIKRQRRHSAALFGLMTKYQRQFTKM